MERKVALSGCCMALSAKLSLASSTSLVTEEEERQLQLTKMDKYKMDMNKKQEVKQDGGMVAKVVRMIAMVVTSAIGFIFIWLWATTRGGSNNGLDDGPNGGLDDGPNGGPDGGDIHDCIETGRMINHIIKSGEKRPKRRPKN